jgi:O-antigen/teichoic acid export membrane protein
VDLVEWGGEDTQSGSPGVALSQIGRRSSGAVAISLGSVVSAGAAYIFLIVAARVLGPARYSALAALWSLTFLIGPGVFGPLEQEACRAISARRSVGGAERPPLTRCIQVGLVLEVALLLGLGVAARPLVNRFFDGHWLLLVGLVLAVSGYYVMQLCWGVLAGTRNFLSYGAVLGSEGVARLLICGVLLGFGARSPGFFGLAVGLAPFVAVGVGWRSSSVHLEPGPPEPWGPTTKAILYLLGGSACRQFLIVMAPLAVQVLSTTADRGTTGRFLAAFTLTRVPLFLFSAALAALLPKLAAQASAGAKREFSSVLLRLSYGVGLMTAVAASLSATIGPAMLRFFFGSSYSVGGGELLLLSVGCGAYLLASVLSYGLIAISGQSLTTRAWAAGCLVRIAFIALSPHLGLVTRVAVGFLAGNVASLLTMALLLAWQHAGHPWSLHAEGLKSETVTAVG